LSWAEAAIKSVQDMNLLKGVVKAVSVLCVFDTGAGLNAVAWRGCEEWSKQSWNAASMWDGIVVLMWITEE
jgi:hypothetical protein